MSRIMEEIRDETAEKTAFATNVAAISKMMKKLNFTVQEALNFLEIPESEHARYIVAIRDEWDQS